MVDGVSADRRDDVVVEVPLTGDDQPAHEVGEPEHEAPNWRRLVGITLALGIVLGVAGAAVRLAVDGDASDPKPTGDPSPAITTPPTLRPLETLPPPDPEPVDANSSLGSGTPTASAPPQQTEPVVVPTYPPGEGGLSGVVEYDIATAVARLGDDLSRRSDTHVELGYGGYVLDVVIERDPERDRYRLVFESGEVVEEVIVDVASGITYVQPGTDSEQQIPNNSIVGTGDDGDVNAYFDRFLLGPLRPDTFDEVRTRGRGIVTIEGVGDAREFVAYIDGDTVPEWQIYGFGPVGEFAGSERPELMEYSVYVAGAGDERIVQVDGVALLGNVPQLVQHRMTVPDEPIVIELPGETLPETTATTTP